MSVNVFRAVLTAFLVAFLAVGVASVRGGCTGTADSRRAAAIQTLYTVAASADIAGDTVLQGYCQAQGRALNQPLEYTAGRCLPASSQVPRRATPDEADALERVRQAWRPVIRAHGRVADAHDAAAAVVQAEAEPSLEAVLGALGRIFHAFPELVDAARGVGITLPDLPSQPPEHNAPHGLK